PARPHRTRRTRSRLPPPQRSHTRTTDRLRLHGTTGRHHRRNQCSRAVGAATNIRLRLSRRVPGLHHQPVRPHPHRIPRQRHRTHRCRRLQTTHHALRRRTRRHPAKVRNRFPRRIAHASPQPSFSTTTAAHAERNGA